MSSLKALAIVAVRVRATERRFFVIRTKRKEKGPAARKEFLLKEKEFARLRDELSRQRRESGTGTSRLSDIAAAGRQSDCGPPCKPKTLPLC